MHELSLFGQVAHSRHEQVLNILAGLAAMQPQPMYERRLIYQPLRPSTSNPTSKKTLGKQSQAQPLAYIQLIKTLHDDDFGKSSPVSSGAGKSDQPDWNMRIQYTPEPETKALVLRQVVDEQISGDSLEQYLDPSKYRLVNAYIVEGQRLICKDIILTMHRVLYYKDADRAQAMPHADLPLLEDLILLDLSGAFLLEASVRIDDRTKPVQVQKATEELKWFKNEMRGSVDLRTPERLALDTRVRDS